MDNVGNMNDPYKYLSERVPMIRTGPSRMRKARKYKLSKNAEQHYGLRR